MVKCFWPLKDLNVLVEMLFVTVKNAIQGHRQEISAPDIRKRHYWVSELLILILALRHETRTYLPFEINLQNMTYIP